MVPSWTHRDSVWAPGTAVTYRHQKQGISWPHPVLGTVPGTDRGMQQTNDHHQTATLHCHNPLPPRVSGDCQI
ncbi:cytochrome P450 aromatase [Anopheles sinensis]|uniref:Cytochrome P450 aromatase n=1 Tax=Anopheles sinensis TaxID=74873 RepID=A0A084WKQ6_ANOSI|nr:cytochrome P450 aromatase [Anopheles sinensis]